MESIISPKPDKSGTAAGDLRLRDFLFISITGSSGCGKTSLILRTAGCLPDQVKVIASDFHTALDAEKYKQSKVLSCQINPSTHPEHCHPVVNLTEANLSPLELKKGDLLFLENVGSLVCPVVYDIQAHLKGSVISITEGENVPLKYPQAFKGADFCLITKLDLLRYLDLDLQKLIDNLYEINPKIKIIKISSKTREGFEDWKNYLLGIGDG